MMQPMLIWGLIVFVVIGIAALVALTRAVTLGGASDDPPRCGSCNQNIIDDGLHCTRCRADLRRVGIVTAPLRFKHRSGSTVLISAGVLLTLLWWSACAVTWSFWSLMEEVTGIPAPALVIPPPVLAMLFIGVLRLDLGARTKEQHA